MGFAIKRSSPKAASGTVGLNNDGPLGEGPKGFKPMETCSVCWCHKKDEPVTDPHQAEIDQHVGKPGTEYGLMPDHQP